MAAIGQLFLEALADGKPVYGRDLASRLGVPADNIRLAGHRLVQRGYVQRAEGCYQITDAGQAFLASGKHRTSGPERGDFVARGRMSLRARVWNLIRMRNLWSIDDLLMTVADGTEKDAENGVRRYVRALKKAGYVESSRRNPDLYMLIRNTGRQAPSLSTPSRTLTDPNTGEVHHV